MNQQNFNENDKILTKTKNTKKTKIEQHQNFTKTTKSHRGQNLHQNNKIRTKSLTKRQNCEPNSTKNPKFYRNDKIVSTTPKPTGPQNLVLSSRNLIFGFRSSFQNELIEDLVAVRMVLERA